MKCCVCDNEYSWVVFYGEKKLHLCEHHWLKEHEKTLLFREFITEYTINENCELLNHKGKIQFIELDEALDTEELPIDGWKDIKYE